MDNILILIRVKKKLVALKITNYAEYKPKIYVKLFTLFFKVKINLI